MILLLVYNKVRTRHTLAVFGRIQLMLNVKKAGCRDDEKKSMLGSKVTFSVTILLCTLRPYANRLTSRLHSYLILVGSHIAFKNVLDPNKRGKYKYWLYVK